MFEGLQGLVGKYQLTGLLHLRHRYLYMPVVFVLYQKVIEKSFQEKII